MRNLCQILSVCILSLTSVAQAGGMPPYCWSLDAGLLGVSPTTLRLHAIDMGGQYSVLGTASFDIITFPSVTRVRLVNGTATTVNDKIEISLNASGVEDIEDSEQKRLWTGTYHLILDAATLNGIALSRASEDASFNPARREEASQTTCQ